MSTAFQALKRRLFWVIARLCFTLYRAFPLFGSLRASIAVIQRDGAFLVIERSDGRGLSFPGGIAGWREDEEAVLRREVREETGLELLSRQLQCRYHSTVDVPCNISVFTAAANGELKESWEGTPHWMTFAEIEPRLLESQRPVLQLLTSLSASEANS